MFQNLNSTTTTTVASLTPAACIRSCLQEDSTFRFASGCTCNFQTWLFLLYCWTLKRANRMKFYLLGRRGIWEISGILRGKKKETWKRFQQASSAFLTFRQTCKLGTVSWKSFALLNIFQPILTKNGNDLNLEVQGSLKLTQNLKSTLSYQSFSS